MPDVKLFGRKMRRSRGGARYELCGSRVVHYVDDTDSGWEGYHPFVGWTAAYLDSQSAARALERKIRAAHARLGKLIDGKKGRGK